MEAMTDLEFVEISNAADPELHSSWRIALYYLYIDLTGMVEEQVAYHRKICERMGFSGRIRISSEGINGVLSGLLPRLEEYESLVCQSLRNSTANQMALDECATSTTKNGIDLDMKYCMLREDLPIEAQLFENLMVKETKSVISLFDSDPSDSQSKNTNKRSKQFNRRHRRKEQKQQQRMLEMKHQSQQATDENLSESPLDHSSSQSRLDLNRIHEQMMELSPSQHLDAQEWNNHLRQAQNTGDALLLDVRNVYESRVGHFSAPGVGTLLTNTRKYSDLPQLLATSKNVQEKRKIFMYCTGGVRCERVSMLVQSLYPEKQIYQLQGGIQTYLRTVQDTRNCCIGETIEDGKDGEEGRRIQKEKCKDENLFCGKNFVFDPRRTDPVHFGEIIGKCLVCRTPHDDYDNGHAPNENKAARCNTCRMLVLVCDSCRPNYKCWGEDGDKPLLYCGKTRCTHEGAAPQPELVLTSM